MIQVNLKMINRQSFILLLVVSSFMFKLLSVSAEVVQPIQISNATRQYVGMPIGGVCAGQVYLSADGQLWNWDIFNCPLISPYGCGGSRYYFNPLTPHKTFAQGFGVKIVQDNHAFYRSLDSNGFCEINFVGKYPMGVVKYEDPLLPISVELQAMTPFIPTNVEDSSFPAVILEYTIKNTSDKPLTVDLNGWLQNQSCHNSALSNRVSSSGWNQINRVITQKNMKMVSLGSDNKFRDSLPDWGDMCLGLTSDENINIKATSTGVCDLGTRIYQVGNVQNESSAAPLHPLVATVGGSTKLQPNESRTFKFIISWYFPNFNRAGRTEPLINKKYLRHYYSKNFKNAVEVATYISSNVHLEEDTKIWVDSWYDSTLPKWFLDRTMVGTTTLATNVCRHLSDTSPEAKFDGRFYENEGLYIGEGTCTHVRQYGQALGRIFPTFSQSFHEMIDLRAFFKDSIIGYRGEFSYLGQHLGKGFAVDGQAGVILQVYRDYLLGTNPNFLKSNWLAIKQAMLKIITLDKDKKGRTDGILEGPQYNTLDRIWYGKIAWISGLYAAALRASAKMAHAVGDRKFEKQCTKIAEESYINIPKELFNGEFLIQKIDTAHMKNPNTNEGCHTDQLLGQYWASQLGLGTIMPREVILKCLKSIMKYNYVEHYGDYLKKAKIPIARWYADDDEPAVIVCSFPNGGEDIAPGRAVGALGNDKIVVGYFSECWTGQEHALAALLLDMGMVDEGFKVEGNIQQRYDAHRRNPYNEIEYGNHYTRAMSSYAPFVSATGFKYDLQAQHFSFHPVDNVANFRSAYVASRSWGTISQHLASDEAQYAVKVNYGSLSLKSLTVFSKEMKGVKRHDLNFLCSVDGKMLKVSLEKKGDKFEILFHVPLVLGKGSILSCVIRNK